MKKLGLLMILVITMISVSGQAAVVFHDNISGYTPNPGDKYPDLNAAVVLSQYNGGGASVSSAVGAYSVTPPDQLANLSSGVHSAWTTYAVNSSQSARYGQVIFRLGKTGNNWLRLSANGVANPAYPNLEGSYADEGPALLWHPGGDIRYRNNTGMYVATTNPEDVLFNITINYDLDLDVYEVWLDNTKIVSSTSFENALSTIESISIGSAWWAYGNSEVLDAWQWEVSEDESFMSDGTVEQEPFDPLADPTDDGKINFEDYVMIAGNWLDSCNSTNSWCDGADLDQSSSVNTDDMFILSQYWLGHEDVPVTIPVTDGLTLHLDASDIDGDGSLLNDPSEGAVVNSWKDISGQDNDPIVTGGPTYHKNVQNGKATVRFDGSDDSAECTSTLTAQTVFVVAKFDNEIFSSANGLITSSSIPHYYFIGNSQDEGKSWYTIDDRFENFYVNAAATSNIATLNQFNIYGGIDYNADAIINMYIGSDRDIGDRRWNGDIAEVIVYDRVLNSAELQRIGYYLTLKYGIYTTYTSDWMASDPDPFKGAKNVALDKILAWTEGYDMVSQEVYIGATFEEVKNRSVPAVYPDPCDAASYTPLTLEERQTYYWCVDSIDSLGLTHEGEIWDFTAMSMLAWEPIPVNEANKVPVDTYLSWTPGGLADSHNVYISTNFSEVSSRSIAPLHPAPAEANSYDFPNDLDFGTTYYWCVDEVNDPCIWDGPVWSFETCYGTAESNYYVAADGNDDNPGTLAEPFKTIDKARNVIEYCCELPYGGVTVWLRGGTYPIEEPLVFGPNDSGTVDNTIVYKAYPSETPIISGGKAITGWTPGPGDLWTSQVPDGWDFRQLFIDGSRRQRARSNGLYSMSEASPPTQAFQYNPGDINASWTNLNDVEVVILQHWVDSRLIIDNVNESSRVVTFTGTGRSPSLAWSLGYYVENVFEHLDEPGEWYLNRQTDTLYYWPLPGEDMTTVEVIAPVIEQMVRFEGDVDAGRFIDYITFDGLHFYYSDWSLLPEGHNSPQADINISAVIYATGLRHSNFNDCVIAHVGTWGIDLSRGCQYNTIVDNRIFDIGAGGIKIGEPIKRENAVEEACHTMVTDNYIYEGGRVYPGAVGIFVAESSYNTISHNEIYDLYYSGISVGWLCYDPATRCHNNTVEYNHIHHVLQNVMHCGGGIYTLGYSYGTVLRYNLIHDIYHYSSGSLGFHIDGDSRYLLIENNLVYNTSDGFHFNYDCIFNVVQNNIFALTTNYQWIRYGDTPPPIHQNSNETYCNIYYWKEGGLFRETSWPDFNTEHDYNLYFDPSGRPIIFLTYTFAQWQALGMDVHSVIADPLFADPENGDFTLAPESPAFGLGFVPFDLSTVGPRP